MKKRISFCTYGFVLFLISSFLFLGFPSEAVSAPKSGGTFKLIRYTGAGRSIGFSPGIGRTDRTDAQCALESLLRFHLDLRMEPMLATSWKIAPDRKSVTFNLRKGVKFHDNTDWNADAAKFNNYTAGQTREEKSQVFDHIKDMVTFWKDEARVATNQVRIVGMLEVPPRDKDTPSG